MGSRPPQPLGGLLLPARALPWGSPGAAGCCAAAATQRRPERIKAAAGERGTGGVSSHNRGGSKEAWLGLGQHSRAIPMHCLHAALLLGTWTQSNDRLPPPYLPLCITKPRLATAIGDICAQWRCTRAAARGALTVVMSDRLGTTAERARGLPGMRASMRLSSWQHAHSGCRQPSTPA